MRRLYRVYYSTFSDEAHENVKRAIMERYNAQIVDHPSRVHPDFRFIEILLETPGLEEEIRDLVRDVAETLHVKVDWIDTTK